MMYWDDDREWCDNCNKPGSKCSCCETCGATSWESCICCPHCHGVGERPLLSVLEWDYIGPDYGICPDCGGSGHR